MIDPKKYIEIARAMARASYATRVAIHPYPEAMEYRYISIIMGFNEDGNYVSIAIDTDYHLKDLEFRSNRMINMWEHYEAYAFIFDITSAIGYKLIKICEQINYIKQRHEMRVRIETEANKYYPPVI